MYREINPKRVNCGSANESPTVYVELWREMGGFCCLTSLSTIFTVISWRSVLLVEETGVPGENHRPAARH